MLATNFTKITGAVGGTSRHASPSTFTVCNRRKFVKFVKFFAKCFRRWFFSPEFLPRLSIRPLPLALPLQGSNNAMGFADKE